MGWRGNVHQNISALYPGYSNEPQPRNYKFGPSGQFGPRALALRHLRIGGPVRPGAPRGKTVSTTHHPKPLWVLCGSHLSPRSSDGPLMIAGGRAGSAGVQRLISPVRPSSASRVEGGSQVPFSPLSSCLFRGPKGGCCCFHLNLFLETCPGPQTADWGPSPSSPLSVGGLRPHPHFDSGGGDFVHHFRIYRPRGRTHHIPSPSLRRVYAVCGGRPNISSPPQRRP